MVHLKLFGTTIFTFLVSNEWHQTRLRFSNRINQNCAFLFARLHTWLHKLLSTRSFSHFIVVNCLSICSEFQWKRIKRCKTILCVHYSLYFYSEELVNRIDIKKMFFVEKYEQMSKTTVVVMLFVDHNSATVKSRGMTVRTVHNNLLHNNTQTHGIRMKNKNPCENHPSRVNVWTNGLYVDT